LVPSPSRRRGVIMSQKLTAIFAAVVLVAVLVAAVYIVVSINFG